MRVGCVVGSAVEPLLTRTDASVDILQPDVSHCGGISELKRIAAMAETYDGKILYAKLCLYAYTHSSMKSL